jgi:hypothetical protein
MSGMTGWFPVFRAAGYYDEDSYHAKYESRGAEQRVKSTICHLKHVV